MFVVSRSTTGQYVVSDPATNTVVVGDDLGATFERLAALVADKPARADVPAPASAPARASLKLVPYVALALLPFVWLGALHLSLGRLVSELRQATVPAAPTEALTQIGARLDRLERQAESRPAAITPHRPSAPRPPAGVVNDDDDDDPDDDDAKADVKADAKAEAKADAKAPPKPEPIEPDDDNGGD
jgi:hypothetical protein